MISRVSAALLLGSACPCLAVAGCAGRAAVPAAVAVPPGAPGVLVDRVVAVVLGRPITLSETRLEARIARASAGNAAGAMGTLDAEDEARTLTELVDRHAVLRGLRAQYPDTIDPRMADLELARIRAFFDADSWKAFLARLELTEDELRVRRRRALEADAIVSAKLIDVARIDTKTLAAYMQRHPEIGSREEAEAALLAEMAPDIRKVIIADARRVTAARIVPLDVVVDVNPAGMPVTPRKGEGGG